MHYRHSLIKDIQKAINGEYSAITCYQNLAQAAAAGEEKQTIQEIRRDEVKHYHEFSEIFTCLTGSMPASQIIETCPTDYAEGLKAAFKDEQETVDFYLEIADKAEDPSIAGKFRRAAADEQNHAVWFSFFSTSRCR